MIISFWPIFCTDSDMQNSLRKIHAMLIVFALITAATIYFWQYLHLTPYRLTLVSTESLQNSKDRLFYRDLDGDGYSERFMLQNDPTEPAYYLKIYRFPTLPKKGRIIDQYNFMHPIQPKLFFGDVDGDGSEEVFLFSFDDSTLFLSVIDVRSNVYLARERFLMAAPKDIPYIKWDVEIIDAAFEDLNKDGKKEMIFTLHSGHSLRPRGIFILDVAHWRIINRRLYHAGHVSLTITDFQGDGFPEFILSSYASDNFKSNEN